MKFSVAMCHVLTVIKKRNPIISDYTLHGKVLRRMSSTKYLGAELTEHLHLEKHIYAATAKPTKPVPSFTEVERMLSNSPLTVLQELVPFCVGVYICSLGPPSEEPQV